MPKKEFDFKKSYEELEEIVTWFERDDLDLAQAMKKLEEGLILVKECEKSLTNAENKILEIKAKFDK